MGFGVSQVVSLTEYHITHQTPQEVGKIVILISQMLRLINTHKRVQRCSLGGRRLPVCLRPCIPGIAHKQLWLLSMLILVYIPRAQDGDQEFKVNMNYTVNLRLAWAMIPPHLKIVTEIFNVLCPFQVETSIWHTLLQALPKYLLSNLDLSLSKPWPCKESFMAFSCP